MARRGGKLGREKRPACDSLVAGSLSLHSAPQELPSVLPRGHSSWPLRRGWRQPPSEEQFPSGLSAFLLAAFRSWGKVRGAGAGGWHVFLLSPSSWNSWHSFWPDH